MNNNQNNTLDDGFEVAGKWPTLDPSAAQDKKRTRKKKLLIAFITAIILLVLAIFLYIQFGTKHNVENGVFDPEPQMNTRPVYAHLGVADSTVSYTEKLDTTINDVVMSIYIPHKATPELILGVPNHKDTSIILSAQAADIRADNGKILGAFVLKGEPKAWGLSKKGYCAILDGKISVGVSDNSPLFEEATETGGDFFRQYPLVDNGNVIENEPKNKTMRKALCSRSGQVFVVVSETNESFHDFAQALVDLGVDNAIYLVGGRDSHGWYLGEDKVFKDFSTSKKRRHFTNETYIIWKISE